MKTIYKYEVRPTMLLPEGARILYVGSQNGVEVFLWVEVDTEAKCEEREFYIFGTGHPVKADVPLHYIGTTQTEVGLVWHVYEGVKEYSFTASDVKHVREVTGGGMQESKVALQRAHGDIGKATRSIRLGR